MARLLISINTFIFATFILLYMYQFVYLFRGLWLKRRNQGQRVATRLHHLTVIICARNEEQVLGELLKSFNNQSYPEKYRRAIVVADNCTDRTADIARAYGADVFERFNKEKVGKGYALAYLLDQILTSDSPDEAYIIIDADNLLDKYYLAEMNRIYDAGYRAATSYRNSKNYEDNWISAGYALWFLREAEYLNRPRMAFGTSCAVSGTGFMFARDLLKDWKRWSFFTLTEDIEFTAANILKGEIIGYAKDAMLYDEQPNTFKSSWIQRKRWAKGFYQVFGRYGSRMVAAIFNINEKASTRFSNFDMIMTIMPALFVTLFGLIFNIIMWLYAFFYVSGSDNAYLLLRTSQAIGMFFLCYYGVLFFIGCITMATEHRYIRARYWSKLKSLFTFPVFMFTYVPIAVAALFMKVEWEPVPHTVVKSIDDM